MSLMKRMHFAEAPPIPRELTLRGCSTVCRASLRMRANFHSGNWEIDICRRPLYSPMGFASLKTSHELNSIPDLSRLVYQLNPCLLPCTAVIAPIDRINMKHAPLETLFQRFVIKFNKIIIIIFRFKTGIIYNDVNFLFYDRVVKFTVRTVRPSSEYKINVVIFKSWIYELPFPA